jgi:hypothetical protein
MLEQFLTLLLITLHQISQPIEKTGPLETSYILPPCSVKGGPSGRDRDVDIFL